MRRVKAWGKLVSVANSDEYQIDLAEAVGADLGVMDRDARRMR